MTGKKTAKAIGSATGSDIGKENGIGGRIRPFYQLGKRVPEL